MQKDLQPEVYKDTMVKCACGNTFTTISTQPEIIVNICSKCHPFYTGKQKFVDTEGRIEKFEKKLKISQAKQKAAKNKTSTKEEKKTDKKKKKRTLKEMLEKAKTEEE